MRVKTVQDRTSVEPNGRLDIERHGWTAAVDVQAYSRDIPLLVPVCIRPI